jgi:hypothetical protein
VGRVTVLSRRKAGPIYEYTRREIKKTALFSEKESCLITQQQEIYDECEVRAIHLPYFFLIFVSFVVQRIYFPGRNLLSHAGEAARSERRLTVRPWTRMEKTTTTYVMAMIVSRSGPRGSDRASATEMPPLQLAGPENTRNQA